MVQRQISVKIKIAPVNLFRKRRAHGGLGRRLIYHATDKTCGDTKVVNPSSLGLYLFLSHQRKGKKHNRTRQRLSRQKTIHAELGY